MSVRNIRRPIPRHRRAAARSAVAAEPLERRQLLSTVVVNTTADSTDPAGSKTVSLRDAIAVANAATSATTITFSPTVFNTAKTITLGGTQLLLSNTKASTTITGPAAGVTVSGNNKSRVFQISANVTAAVAGMTMTAGYTATDGACIDTSGDLTLTGCTVSHGTDADVDKLHGGGGIANFGKLVLNSVIVSDNQVPNSYDGGIYNNQSGILSGTDVTIEGNTSKTCAAVGNNGVMTLADSAVLNNVASVQYGAINNNDNVGVASMTLINDTICDNQAATATGGIASSGTLSITGCTIVGNTSPSGGGLVTTAKVATVANTIVAGNTGGAAPDVSGTFKSLGHNLIGKTDGSAGWISSDYTGTIAKPLVADLGALANNGGPTETLLPLAGSPAIDKGSNSLIPTGVATDQRGLTRIVDGTVDIGAVEVQPSITLTAPAKQSATEGTSTSVTLGSFAQFGATSPFKDTVSWGDGSANTVLTLTAAGTIPATAHAFAKPGTLTVTETITDAKGNTSNVVTFAETVVAPLGSISGTVFDDANGDGKQEKGEIGLGLITVYLDLNDDGKLDAGDTSVTTDINGAFTFTGLAVGTYYLRIVPVAGDVTTTPSGGLLKLVLTAGELSTGNLFGEN